MYGFFEDLLINVSLVITLIFIFMKVRWGKGEDLFFGLKPWMVDGFAGG